MSDEIRSGAAHVGRLLKAGLGLRGDDLAVQLRRGGRMLPRRVRMAAGRLAKAQAVADAPKLAKQFDLVALRRDIKTCVQYLTPLAQRRVQHGWWLRAASWAALVILGLAALAYGVYQLRLWL
jgi:hypothetical protein